MSQTKNIVISLLIWSCNRITFWQVNMSLWFSEWSRLLLNWATPIFPFNSYTYHIVIAVKICCIVMPAHCFALSFLAYFIFAYLPFSIIIVVNSILVLILVWYIFAKYNFYCFWLSFFSMFDAGILGITRLHIAKPQLFFNLTITATVAKLAIKNKLKTRYLFESIANNLRGV